MRDAIRFTALWVALTMSVACGAGDQQQAVPPTPPMMPMDVASGTELHLTLETPVSSETAKPEQAVRARVAKPVVVAGMTVIPEGASVAGIVVAAERSSGDTKGRVPLALRFDRVIVADTPYHINTSPVALDGGATKGATMPEGTTLQTTIQETVRINAPM